MPKRSGNNMFMMRQELGAKLAIAFHKWHSSTFFKKVIFVALMSLLAGCVPSAPPRFPQFAEYAVAGPGTYDLPQWSPDGRYLAFLDRSRDPTLMVYDIETKASWNVATNVSSMHYSWSPNGDLTYLKFRPDLSGSPYPIILDLHRVDLNGENDEIIATNLSSAGDFAWFSGGESIAILLTEPSSRTYFNDVYLLNTTTDTTDLLLEAEDLDLQYVVSLALSPDEKSILVAGIHEDNGVAEGQMVIYNLETQAILDRIIPSQIIPSGNINYPVPTIGAETNFGWVGGQRWLLAKTNTPGGECYNYALFFFDTRDLQNSFCVAASDGPFAAPTISPDLTRISYITVVGPGQSYLMIGNVTSDLLDELELSDD